MRKNSTHPGCCSLKAVNCFIAGVLRLGVGALFPGAFALVSAEVPESVAGGGMGSNGTRVRRSVGRGTFLRCRLTARHKDLEER